MNLPKLAMKYYLLAGLVVVAFIYSQREGISEFIDGIALFAQQNWMMTAGILIVLYVAYWLSKQWEKRMTGEMPPAATVLKWCCYNDPDFIRRGITEDSINWETYEPLITNNRLAVNFQLVDSGQWWCARIDNSLAHNFKVTALAPTWQSQEQREKMSRPEMLYEAAKMVVKKTEEEFEEKKDEV